MVEEAIVMEWRDRVLEIAEEHKSKVEEPATSFEKSPENELFLFSLLNKAKLFVITKVKLQLSRLRKWWDTEHTQDLVAIVGFVLGYGLLGAAVVTALLGDVSENEFVLYVFGCGSAIYLYMDLLKYTADTLKRR